jgi:hypothetical protein
MMQGHHHNHHHSPDNCRICGIISTEKKKGLAELGKIVTGQSRNTAMNRIASPVLPRYKYGMVGYRLGKAKAGSRLPKKIIMHPERQRLNQERSEKLAELYRFVKGE